MSDLQPARALSCPRCQGEALGAFAATGSLTIDLCPRCKGIWCDDGELAPLLDVSADHPQLAAARRAPTLTSTLCPRCPKTSLHRLHFGPSDEIRVDQCPRCLGAWLDGGMVPKLKAQLAVRETAPLSSPSSLGPSRAPLLVRDEDRALRFEYDTPLVNGLALPIALFLALLISLTGMRYLLEGLAINMWLHELGHATIAWFFGYYAIPLPFVTVTFTHDKSLAVSFVLFAALAGACYLGVRTKRPYLLWVGGLGLALQAACTWLLSHRFGGAWLAFAGVAGEFVYSALLCVSFYYRLPDRARWDFFRYLALFFGAFGLVLAMTRWQGVARDLSLLPIGSALGGRSDPHGDMNELLGYGWTARGIARAYVRLGYACFAAVIAHYVVFLRRALAKAKGA